MYLFAIFGLYTAVFLIIFHVGYPVVLAVISICFKKKHAKHSQFDDNTVFVTLIIPVYAKDIHLLLKKLINSSKLKYPSNNLEIMVSGDGDLPELSQIIEQVSSNFLIKYNQTGEWVGKNLAINQSVKKAYGDILIVSDVDSTLAPDAIDIIVKSMSDKQVGGVSGTVKIVKEANFQSDIGHIQKKYWSFELWIKRKEMKSLGSVTSCSGQLYAIRKSIFRFLAISSG